MNIIMVKSSRLYQVKYILSIPLHYYVCEHRRLWQVCANADPPDHSLLDNAISTKKTDGLT